MPIGWGRGHFLLILLLTRANLLTPYWLSDKNTFNLIGWTHHFHIQSVTSFWAQQLLHLLQFQGWRSGESTCLPPMCPRFDSRARHHMWAEFVGFLLCSERLFSGYSGFPLSKNQHLIWFESCKGFRIVKLSLLGTFENLRWIYVL